MKLKANPLLHAISLKSNDAGLIITIQTTHLMIRSLGQEDIDACFSLFRNPIVMETYANGEPYESEKIKHKFDQWTTRWMNHDPFSAYAVIEKQSNSFIGIIGIGHASRGKSDLFYAIQPDFWGKGYGKEMVSAMMQSLIPRLMFHGYGCANGPLLTIEADTRLDNFASQKILQSVGFKEKRRIDKFNMKRSFFEVSAMQLKRDYHQFYAHRDKLRFFKEQRKQIDDDVDITAKEMARSPFGNSRNI